MSTTTIQRTKRLHLLDEANRATLYNRPQFIEADRSLAFTLGTAETVLMETFTDPLVQACFVLQWGYFAAKQRFFTLVLDEVQDDLTFIVEHLGLAVTAESLALPHRHTIQKQRQLILTHTRYRVTHAPERQQLLAVACQAARISPKPQYLMQVVLQQCVTDRIVLPAYTTLQGIIGTAITTEERRLIRILQEHLTPSDIAVLDELFDRTDGRYRLTALQRAPKNLDQGELRRERARASDLLPGYDLATRILPRLGISPEGVGYYASLVGFYGATRLHDLTTEMVDVYLLCFLHHRYQRLHDHLLSGFMHAVKDYRDEAKAAANDQVTAYQHQRTDDLVRAGRVLTLFTTDPASPATTFASVQAQAFAILEPERLAQTATYLTTGAGCDETAFFWQHVDAMARRFKGRLRALILGVDLTATRAANPLVESLQFLKTTFNRGRALTQIDPATIPIRCIPDRLRRYLYLRDGPDAPRLLVDRYEFLVYQQVRAALEAGELVCRQSERFRSLEDDLIPLAEWHAHKTTYLTDLNRPRLLQPITEQLAELEATLEARFAAVNGRIAAGTQPGITITQHGTTRRWSLQTPKVRDPINHALFERLPQVGINELLAFVNDRCGFMDAFDHVLGRNHQHHRDDRVLRACLVAWGTNLGIGRMGQISDITTRTLARASENYLRIETVRAANTALVNAMAAMPLFRHYNIDGVMHSSSDGQKFETERETVNAEHSSKYFGLGKGVVAATLVINNLAAHAQLISAHDHESHCVFDLLYTNPTDLHPTIHSTDTHGTNQVNFALFHVFGHIFAPRYAHIQEKIRTGLYGFHHPSQYGEHGLFRPVRKLNTDLIVRYWDPIQRIFAPLGRKTTTQRILISKLSSSKRRNPVLRALWEFDHAIASGYLLDYVDSPRLRRNVQKALNRGEQYHQLKRAVSHANAGKLRYGTEGDQELWSECSRLLANAILFYNMLLIADALAVREARGDAAGAARLLTVSPIAWVHVNLYGRYLFDNEPATIPLAALVETLAHYSFRAHPEDPEEQSSA